MVIPALMVKSLGFGGGCSRGVSGIFHPFKSLTATSEMHNCTGQGEGQSPSWPLVQHIPTECFQSSSRASTSFPKSPRAIAPSAGAATP